MQLATRLALHAFGSVRVREFGRGVCQGVVLDGRLTGIGGIGDGDDVPVGTEMFAEDRVVRLAYFAALLWMSRVSKVYEGEGINGR